MREKILDILCEYHGNTMTDDEAIDKILALFSVVGRSEQLPCPKCGDYGTIDNQDGTVSTCPCHY